MWIRFRFDIGVLDLAYGVAACAFPANRGALQDRASRCWPQPAETIVCLSIRSGFDALLRVLALPKGSEVLISALTVPDMVRIVEEHGLVPVPVDLVSQGSTPCPESLRRAITPASRVLVVAHLFGARIAMEPILAIAKEHGLLVVEDCAQAFDGRDYVGHRDSDVVMFSFGPIKTATALGGAVLSVRVPGVMDHLRRLQAEYPVQSRWNYMRRLLKYALFKVLAARPAFSAIAWGCTVLGINHDRLVSGAARNFPHGDLLRQIRRQPSAPLLRMLLWRWNRYRLNRLRRRQARGEQLAARLNGLVPVGGRTTESNNFWVFPILVENQADVVRCLRDVGFDGTRESRLTVVRPPDDRASLAPVNAQRLLSKIVFLPWYLDLPDKALKQMAEVLQEIGKEYRGEEGEKISSPLADVAPRV